MKTIFLPPQPLLQEPLLQGVIFNDFSQGITVKSIQKIFSYTHDTKWLSEFIDSFSRYGVTDEKLLTAIQFPATAVWAKPGGGRMSIETYNAETVLQIALFIARLNDLGLLSVIELKHYKTASKIIALASQNTLEREIEAACGLDRFKARQLERFTDYFTHAVQDQSCLWIIKFPEGFWIELQRLYQFTWWDLSENPSKIAPMVFDLFFNRADEKWRESLRATLPKRRYGTKQKIGNQNVETLLTLWLALLKAASDREKFIALLDEISPSAGVPIPKFERRKTTNPGSFGKSLKPLLTEKPGR